jgi:acyl-coenzyme A thioesterase PaaI-like protein
MAPVPIGEPVRVTAQVTRTDDRQATAEATMQDESGMLLAHARADLVEARPEYFLSTPLGRARGLDWLNGG